MKCYRCNKEATTREHVPPLCLFPERKDTNGIDFRKDLITVPSCEKHNSHKSKDDEFLMIALSGIIGNNIVGYSHFQTKVNRALKRKSKLFLNKAVIRNYQEKKVRVKDLEFSFLIGDSDNERLWECFTNIGYGLFLREFDDHFDGELRMIFGFLKYEETKMTQIIRFIEKLYENDDLRREEKGENPDVFTYQFCNPDNDGLIALTLTFYKGTKVYLAFKPKGAAEPSDFAFQMALAGFPTTYHIGGEKFEFNKD